ncbi:MAG: carboxylesterase family protein [Bacteroidia bacterium]|nr:carboxylesterase family protein [Bacteroidia bacterium]
MKRLLFIMIIPMLVLTACASGNKTAGKKIDVNSVRIESGLISGKTGGDGAVQIFMGVPFAAPPVEELRWKAPQPVESWQGVRKCDVPPPSAIQNPPNPFMMWTKEFMAPLEPLSEDCLYLNIWTAAQTSAEKRPVMVWIHGGAFTGGSGTVPLYDGEEMAKKGVVFITINYRLGIFGFFAHPELSAESPNKVSGNYGILDQIEALRWISKNIEAFGGDPGNVTIAGQSAGAFSVNALVVSPLAKGLFHRAIAQSGGMFPRGESLVFGLKDAEEAGVRFCEKMGISSITDLRSKPAQELQKAGARSGLVIDGVVIPQVTETFDAGKQNDVPLITGWNADDGFSFGSPPKQDVYKANAIKTYGEKAEEYLKLFPAGNDEELKQSQKLQSQLFFGWQNYFWALTQSSKGQSKSYLYYFKHIPPGEPNYGAFHSSEFGYALKTLKLWNRPFVKWDYDLSEMMSSYWVNFARNGDPNGEGLPEWPSFSQENRKVIEFGEEVKAVPLPYSDQLEFITNTK